jgi:uncharacterized protein (TIGR00725 family)
MWFAFVPLANLSLVRLLLCFILCKKTMDQTTLDSISIFVKAATIKSMTKQFDSTKILKYSICVSGAAGGPTVKASKDLAYQVGTEIAKAGHIVTTGATVGLPYYAALGAKDNGGMSIGFSPATSFYEHVRKYKLPIDVFDYINYTGMHYIGRDTYLVQSSDAVITVGGRFGSMHEFVTALESGMICGVLVGSGGLADVIQDLMSKVELKPFEKHSVIFESDPRVLVEKIVKKLDAQHVSLFAEAKRGDAHWYLRKDPSDVSHIG